MRAAQKDRLVAHWRVDRNGRADDADVHIGSERSVRGPLGSPLQRIDNGNRTMPSTGVVSSSS